jgi:riboflavin synthase
MFTGIVQSIQKIIQMRKGDNGALTYAIDYYEPVPIGNSVSINGVCQTVVKQDEEGLWFDAIEETLNKTNLSSLQPGQEVNCERAARFGDEIGGHLLSGHIVCTVPLKSIHNNIYTFLVPGHWRKYLFEKGYVALDGISLTIVSMNQESGELSVHLIPETLKRTTLGKQEISAQINLEIDALTQAVVERTEAFLTSLTSKPKQE